MCLFGTIFRLVNFGLVKGIFDRFEKRTVSPPNDDWSSKILLLKTSTLNFQQKIFYASSCLDKVLLQKKLDWKLQILAFYVVQWWKIFKGKRTKRPNLYILHNTSFWCPKGRTFRKYLIFPSACKLGLKPPLPNYISK